MTKISALASAAPASTSLLVGVVNSTTVQFTASQLVSGAISTALSSATALTGGSMWQGDSSGRVVELAPPSSGAILQYSSVSGIGWTKPTSGSILTGNANGTPTWLAEGTSGQVLQIPWGGGVPSYQSRTGWYVERISSQTGSTVATAIVWNNELLDIGSFFTTGTSAVTITDPGNYIMGANVVVELPSTGHYFRLRLLENNSTVMAMDFTYGAATYTIAHVSGPWYFATSGATVSVTVTCTAGFVAANDTRLPSFWGWRIA